MQNTESKVMLKNFGGSYCARMTDVEHKLNTMTKQQMIREIKFLWPELYSKEEDWSYRALIQKPAYVLAIIISQCD